MWRKHDANRDELEGVAERLRAERPEADPLTLDRIKTTAMSRARTATGGRRAGLKRWTVAGLTVGLMAAGTGGVIAAGSSGHGSNANDAAVAQYGPSINCDSNNTILGNNEYNCDENSFNSTTNNNSSTNNNPATNNYTTVNNYYPAATVSAEPKTGVLATKSTKKKKTTSNLKFHVRIPRNGKLRKTEVRIDGKLVKTLRGKRATNNINLHNVPCGKTKVAVVLFLSNGSRVTARHTYHPLCS